MRIRNFVIFGLISGMICCYAQLGYQPLAQEKKEVAKSEKTASGYSVVNIDPTRVQLLGLTTAKVMMRDLTKTIRTVGVIDVDETRIAHIQTKFAGWIEQLYTNFIGKPVKRNQPLFSAYSQELFAAQEEYLLALKDLEQPVEGRFAQEFKDASQELLKSAVQRLELWDISSDQIQQLEKDRVATKAFIIRSPIDGIVLDKKAFVGMNVGPGINTYTIADFSHVWVLADMYENDISLIKLGQLANLTVPALPDKIFEGKVTFIDYVVGTSTRTAKVRFEFANTQYYLKPGMYTTVKFQLNMGKAPALPEEALIDTGERKIVFVAKGEGRFEPQDVKLGFKAGRFYQVISGVKDGDVVVTSAQFLLDSESRLKAFEIESADGHEGQRKHAGH